MKEYILFIVLYILLDSIYIYGLKNKHSQMVTSVQSSSLQIRILPAILFYLMVPIAYIYFIKPLAKQNVHKIILYAGLLGLLMYATFDLTNLALFKGFSTKYAITDITWGITNMILTSLIVFKWTNV